MEGPIVLKSMIMSSLAMMKKNKVGPDAIVIEMLTGLVDLVIDKVTEKTKKYRKVAKYWKTLVDQSLICQKTNEC